MKWILEVSDCPDNAEYPIVGYQQMENGVKRGPFQYKVNDILSALRKANALTDEEAVRDEKSTPTLPFGTIRYSTDPMGIRQRVTMLMPKKIYDIRYHKDNELLAVGFPKLIVQYVIEHERMVNMKVFATLDNNQPVTDDTDLFYFPFPNVEKETGRVCWGQNEAVEIKSLTDLERALIWFISAPFNEDHGVLTTHGMHNFRKLIDTIKEKPFEDEWLVPTGNKFKNLFN